MRFSVGGVFPEAGVGVRTTPGAVASAPTLDRSVSGSIIPRRARRFSAAAVFPEAGDETDELALGLTTLQTIPSTRASSGPTLLPAASRVRQSENCVFCA